MIQVETIYDWDPTTFDMEVNKALRRYGNNVVSVQYQLSTAAQVRFDMREVSVCHAAMITYQHNDKKEA